LDVAFEADLMDVLFAAVEILETRDADLRTFEACNRLYRLVSVLELRSETFEETADLLHRLARAGWQCRPGGGSGKLKSREGVWVHGDARYPREVCAGAGDLPERVREVADNLPNLASWQELVRRVLKVSQIQPNVVVRCVETLEAALGRLRRDIGDLDDREFL